MENENKANVVVDTENKGNEKETMKIDKEALLTEVAELKAQMAKQKNALDKALKDKGDLTKKLRAKQTAEEVELEEKKKADEAKDEYIKQLERENNFNKAKARYIAMGMDADLAESTANAELDGDMETVTSNIKKDKDNAIQREKDEWMKSRPPVNAGVNGSQLTKEQFNAMSLKEKSDLYRTNIEEYNRLNG